MKKIAIILVGLITITTPAICQEISKFSKAPRAWGDLILTDSMTLFIPVEYHNRLLSTNKIALWGDYYSNIVAYDFKTDSYKKLFERDVFIESIRNNYSFATNNADKLKNKSTNWIFLLVKIKDTSGNGRIDESDPSVLFAVSTNGQVLKQLTDEKENVVSLTSFEKQGAFLIKIQRDSDNDQSFSGDDKEFYFKKVNLIDLTLGKGIELK